MRALYKTILILIATLFIGALSISLLQKDLLLFPNTELTRIETYTDAKDSKINKIDTTGDSLIMHAVLGSEAKYPISGVKFYPRDSYIDILRFKSIEIITLPGCSDFNFTLTLFEEGHSILNRHQTHRYFQMENTISERGDTVELCIADLPTPAWWFSMNNVKRESFGAPDFSRCTSMNFSNHPTSHSGDSLTFAIKSIRLKRDRTTPIKVALFSSLALLLIGIIAKAGRPTIRHIAITPQSMELEPRAKKVLGTIAQKYADSTFSLEICAEDTGLSAYHIRKIIQENYHCSFSNYLRLVRIIEGERLLKESEYDIKEIAYRVGFAHPSSFTRSFKDKNSLSPSAFREQ